MQQWLSPPSPFVRHAYPAAVFSSPERRVKFLQIQTSHPHTRVVALSPTLKHLSLQPHFTVAAREAVERFCVKSVHLTSMTASGMGRAGGASSSPVLLPLAYIYSLHRSLVKHPVPRSGPYYPQGSKTINCFISVLFFLQPAISLLGFKSPLKKKHLDSFGFDLPTTSLSLLGFKSPLKSKRLDNS